MEVKFKKLHKEAVYPKFGHHGDAGADLTAVSVSYDEKEDTIIYDTGISVEIPPGYVGLVFPRSSIAGKNVYLTNSVGVIDSSYRGSIKAKFKVNATYWSTAKETFCRFQEDLEQGLFHCHDTEEDETNEYVLTYNTYRLFDRICQLIILPYPQITYVESDELSETLRGDGGFGSTGE